MIINEYTARDTCNKNRTFVDIKCEVCTSVFTRQKRQLRSMCCSRMCLNIKNGSSIKVNCAHCGLDLIRPRSALDGTKSGLLFCNRECKEAAQKYMVEIQPDHYHTGNGANDYRERALKAFPNICVDCGYSNINALEVHHKDRNRSNNTLENLCILCANCHTIRHKLGH